MALPAVAFCATAALFASSLAGVAQASGVPFATGDVLGNVGGGFVKHFSNTGTLLDTLDSTTGTNEGDGMCFDASNDLFATMGFSANTVSKFDNNGNLLAANFGSGYNAHPESCIVDAAGNIYVGQPDGSANVLKFSSSGTLLNSYAPTTVSRGTDWIDLASDQCTLRYTSESNNILQFNVCTNTQLADFVDSLPASPCYAHRILPDGGELVACTSEVFRLSSAGSILKTYPSPCTSDLLFAANLDPDGTTFWTGCYFGGTIYRFNLATGATVTSFATSPNSVLGGIAVVGEPTVSRPPGCTMTSTKNTTQFKTTGGQSIQKEDALSTDLTASQKLVLRSLSGPSQYFKLSSLTSASCHDVTKYPAEEGGSVNTFNGTGTGSFGTDRTHASPGFSIKFELADRGDTTGSDDTSVDFVNFTVTNGSGAVVWTGKGTLTGGSQEIGGTTSSSATRR